MQGKAYFERHPVQRAIFKGVESGSWLTYFFEWLFRQIGLFAGYVMTLAVGYLIFYAIEYKKGLDAIPANGPLTDQLAILSNEIINVAPELVFPGVVVLCIRAFTARRKIDAGLYLVTTVVFFILTMVLLNAFMNNAIDRQFLASMLFWRAVAALFYTVVVAYCTSHDGGLDFGALVKKLKTMTEEAEAHQEEKAAMQKQLEATRTQVGKMQEAIAALQKEKTAMHQDKQREIAQLQEALTALQTLQNTTSAKLQNADDLRASLQNAELQNVELQNAYTAKCREVDAAIAELQKVKEDLAKVRLTGLQKADTLQDAIAVLTAKEPVEQGAGLVLPAKYGTAKMPTANSATAKEPTAKGGTAKGSTAKEPTAKITSIDQARAKHDSAKGKATNEEVAAFMRKNPAMKPKEVAEALQISERKVYIAKAWVKEQEGKKVAR